MSCPYISVVTAPVGGAGGLRARAEALRVQSLLPERFEWLVCAEEQDAVAEMLEPLDLPFKVRLVEVERGSTAGAARNAGARRTCGGLLLFSDEDVLPGAECLSAHVRLQEAGLCVALGVLDPVGARPRRRIVRSRRLGANGAGWSMAAARFGALGGFDEGLVGVDLAEAELERRIVAARLPFRTVPGVTARRDPGLSARPGIAEAREAGASAARRARADPGLARTLGVHPWQLGLRRATVPGRDASLRAGGGGYRDLQRAFAEGAAVERRRPGRVRRPGRASTEDVR